MAERALHIVLYRGSWTHWWKGEDAPFQSFSSRDEAIEAARTADFDPPVLCFVQDECGNPQESWYVGRAASRSPL